MHKVVLTITISSFLFSYRCHGQFPGQHFDSLSLIMSNALGRDGQQLHIGDIVPDIKGKAVNYEWPEISLSSFKGKWVILDFWSNGCFSCIAAMPRLKKLEEEHENKLIIVPITFQSASDSKWTLDRVVKHIGERTTLYSIVEDTTTYSLFSAYSNPFEVWISPEGKLIAMTDLGYVNNENVEAAIKGKPIHFEDYSKKHNRLFDDTENADERIAVYKSVITVQSRVSGWTSNFLIQKTADGSKKIFLNNHSIVQFYKKAFAKLYPQKMTEVTKEDDSYYQRSVSTNFLKTPYDSMFLRGSYAQKNMVDDPSHRFYCYELIMPGYVSDMAMAKKMISDLDAFFNIRSSIGPRNVKCLKLVKMPGFKVLPPTNEKDSLIEISGGNQFYKPNGAIQDYIDVLTKIPSLEEGKIPIIIDGTGIKGMIHLPLALAQGFTVKEVVRQLHKYKLDLAETTKQMEVLVLERKVPVLK